MISLDLQTRVPAQCAAPSEAGFSAALHPLLGSVSSLNTSKIWLFLSSSTSQSCVIPGKQKSLVLERHGTRWEADDVLECVESIKLGSSSVRQMTIDWTGVVQPLTSETLPLPRFHRAVASVSCCTGKPDCSSYTLRPSHLQHITIL